MAKKKAVTEQRILDLFMAYCLENGKSPKSIYSFSKNNDFDEQEFYNFFGSFEAIEKNIFKMFFTNTVEALAKSDDYNSYDARHKLLSFYYTFFETLTANRSYVLLVLNQNKNSLKSLKVLTKLKNSYTSYIESLNIETLDIPQKQIQQIQKKALTETAWMQLLITMKFWMDDTSAGFEKTDIFIEKSVNTSFDVLHIAPLKSIIDLGKFLFKEKAYMN